MADNVFGTPIISSTLHEMPRYLGKEIKRLDRGLVALNLKNAEDKDKNAREYVEKLKQQCRDRVSTLCLIYNATGNPLTLVNNQDWCGHLGRSPFPTRIENGQWAAFLHTQVSSQAFSEAAVVYRDAGKSCDFMLAWSNKGSQIMNNKAYTEIRDSGHWNINNHWEYIKGLIQKSMLYNSDSRNKYESISIVSIGNGDTPVFEAILAVEGGI